MSEKLPEGCRAELCRGIKQLNLTLTEGVIDNLLIYLSLLVKWNKAYNLTAIREPREMVRRHLLDSLAVLPYLGKGSLLDVGTGPGIPGVIIAVCQPNQVVHLIDANGKKTRFLQHLKIEMGLKNIEVIQSRAENYSPDTLFDRIISRAFTALDNMIDWCQHLLAEDGLFLAMKGAYPEPNQAPLPQGWSVTELHTLKVPFVEEQRHLVCIGRNKD